MHIYFSGIGGSGMGPLAQVAKQAGYTVSGSDAKASDYLKYLTSQGIYNIHVGQTKDQIARVHAKEPIDWLVYTPAVTIENPKHPELEFCKESKIKATRYDELLQKIIADHGLKLIAIAGTHGKTTTTAMTVWLFKQLGLPLSYSVGTKINFGAMGEFNKDSPYFVLEADEYERKFLSFKPFMSLISGIDWDHPDIYPSRELYYQAFREFTAQCDYTVIWHADAEKLGLPASEKIMLLHDRDYELAQIKLTGEVNRRNAWLVAKAIYEIADKPLNDLISMLNKFPGLSRRFEKIAKNIYSDYAHTPAKIRGALQMAHEIAGNNVVVVYEGLHNLRQHFIKDDLKDLFNEVKELYIVPSYLARENPNLPTLEPEDLKNLLSEIAQRHAHTAKLDDQLKQEIKKQTAAGNTVLCFSAGGGGSLDEWLRTEFK